MEHEFADRCGGQLGVEPQAVEGAFAAERPSPGQPAFATLHEREGAAVAVGHPGEDDPLAHPGSFTARGAGQAMEGLVRT